MSSVSSQKREQIILAFLQKAGQANHERISQAVQKQFGIVSRPTIVLDIQGLLKKKLIKKNGKGRGIFYEPSIKNPLLFFIDPAVYFLKEPDERAEKKISFDFSVFETIHELFTKKELDLLQNKNTLWQNRFASLSEKIQKKEFERLLIEFSWKSSRIEGNTYSLLETERLLKEQQETAGHTKEEAIMLLNHKKAFEFIWKNPKEFTRLTQQHIEYVHQLLIKNLGVQTGFRLRPVGITGTVYEPLDNQHQIQEAIEKMIQVVNKQQDPFSMALVAMVLLAYIQPFEDGNKRASRLMGNALLLGHKTCPLSFRSINEIDYKKAIILFYEQQSLLFFKKLFIEQFIFSVDHYFLG